MQYFVLESFSWCWRCCRLTATCTSPEPPPSVPARFAADSFSDDTSLDVFIGVRCSSCWGKCWGYICVGELWILPGKEKYNEENIGKCDLFPSFSNTFMRPTLIRHFHTVEALNNHKYTGGDGVSCWPRLVWWRGGRCWFVATVIDLTVTKREWAPSIHADNKKKADFISRHAWFEIARATWCGGTFAEMRVYFYKGRTNLYIQMSGHLHNGSPESRPSAPTPSVEH